LAKKKLEGRTWGGGFRCHTRLIGQSREKVNRKKSGVNPRTGGGDEGKGYEKEKRQARGRRGKDRGLQEG